ncbi:hypothetical protein ABZP36_024140 [Zizania latifolia]
MVIPASNIVVRPYAGRKRRRPTAMSSSAATRPPQITRRRFDQCASANDRWVTPNRGVSVATEVGTRRNKDLLVILVAGFPLARNPAWRRIQCSGQLLQCEPCRQYAQRSCVRKLQYIAELERRVQALQTEGVEVSVEMDFLGQQNIMLDVENKALKQRLESLSQEHLIKCFQQEMFEREIGCLRSLFQQQQQQQHIPQHKAHTVAVTAETSIHNLQTW